MKRFFFTLLFTAVAMANPVNPRYIEDLVFGGGPLDVDGGAWIDRYGNAHFSGDVEIGGNLIGVATGILQTDIDTEAKLEAIVTDVSNFFTNNDTITDVNVADVLTIGAGSSVVDSALSANIPRLNAVSTIVADWVNIAYPWADAEVADNLTISGGTINSTVIGGVTPTSATFTNATVANLYGSSTIMNIDPSGDGLLQVFQNAANFYNNAGRVWLYNTVASTSSPKDSLAFFLKNSSEVYENYGSIWCVPVNYSDGSEDASWKFALIKDGVVDYQVLLLTSAGDLTMDGDLTVSGGDIFGPATINIATAITVDALNINASTFGTSVPASATAAGTTGQIRFDGLYMYVCTATNTWKRVALSTW